MRTRFAFFSFMFLSSTMFLGACAYTLESSNQEITFVSPNAKEAKCSVIVDKRKYQIFPPQTLNIKKSPNDMIVSCDAPGNRHVEITVPAKFETKAIWGTPAGMAWDYASQSLYYYPELIAIDFSQEPVTPNLPPVHNNDDIIQPEEHDLEEFLPSKPMLNKDKDHIHTPLLRKDDDQQEEIIIEVKEFDESLQSSKGDLKSVIDELAETPTEVLQDEASSLATKGSGGDDASSTPLELFPGQ